MRWALLAALLLGCSHPPTHPTTPVAEWRGNLVLGTDASRWASRIEPAWQASQRGEAPPHGWAIEFFAQSVPCPRVDGYGHAWGCWAWVDAPTQTIRVVAWDAPDTDFSLRAGFCLWLGRLDCPVL